jgi:hypothetical protein
MADGERRMLFDLRGRRKHVVKFVYAILAVMMGASLFLVVGPVNIGELLNTADEVDRSAEVFDEQVERTEQRLRQDPKNEAILISLTRAQLNSGRAHSELDPVTGDTTVTARARNEYENATETWERYLKAAKKDPNAPLAQQISQAWIVLAENPGRGGVEESFESLNEAVAAQQVYAEVRPTLSSVGTLAILQLIAGQFAAGEKTGKRAEGLAKSKTERKAIAKQLAASRKQGKENLKIKKEAAKAEKGKGKEALENPLGGLGGSTGTTIAP